MRVVMVETASPAMFFVALLLYVIVNGKSMII